MAIDFVPKFMLKKSYIVSTGLTGLAAAIGLVGVTGALLMKTPAAIFRNSEVDQITHSLQEREIVALSKQLAELKHDQAQIRQALQQKSIDVETRIIIQRVETIERKQKLIEDAIMTGPEKALSLPLLRNDLNGVKEANAQQIASLQASVDQVYDLSKWLLGALSLSIVGLALARLLNTKAD